MRYMSILYRYLVESNFTVPETVTERGELGLIASSESQSVMGEQSTTVNPLEQFVLLAKNAKGAAAVELIKQALEAPAVFVFGELLGMANIQVVLDCLSTIVMLYYGMSGSDQRTPRCLSHHPQYVRIWHIQRPDSLY